MLDVLVENCSQVTVTLDERPVETLVADGPHEAFGERVRFRGTNRGPDHPDALGAEDVVERPGKFGVSVSDEEPSRRDVGGHGEVAGLLGHPSPVRAGRDAGEVHASAAQFDEEQHVQPAQPHGLDGEEVTRQDTVRLVS
jgi:hypothetical protein